MSPAWRRRISSATRQRAWKSRPSTWVSRIPSATVSSSPSSARPRMVRTSGPAQFRSLLSTGRFLRPQRLPASPALEVRTDEAVRIDVVGHARAECAIQEFGSGGVLGVDGEALAQLVARRLGGPAQLPQQGPGPFRVDVVGGEGRDSAPVIEAGGGEAAIAGVGEVRRRLGIALRPDREPTAPRAGPETRRSLAPHTA